MKLSKNIFLIFLVFVFGFGANLSAQKKRTVRAKKEIIVSAKAPLKTTARNLSPELRKRVETFDYAWQIIKNNYFDQTFNGLDWDKIYREYQPRALKTATDEQLHDILQEMLNRLDRSHLAIIPPEVFRAIETAKSEARIKESRFKKNAKQSSDVAEQDDETEDEEEFDFSDYAAKYGIGVELRLIENQFVVTRVEANSSAEKAGVKTGYAIEKINDVSLAELLKRIEIYYSKIRNVKKHLPGEVVEYLLDGEKDSFVTLLVSGENGQGREIEVQRERLKGESISIGENYPEQFLKFEASSLNDQIGYIKFNVFALPVIEKFCAALTELKGKQAIIVDLRGNTGGILGSMIGLGGMLTDGSIDLGTSIYKIGSENMSALSKAKNFKGRLVFLVDNQTASAAEIFSAGLQENNRALIVGEKTAGEALPAISVSLPTGAVLLYPIANFKTRNGNYLEGRGVEPNFLVSLDRKSLLGGKDSQLEAAVRIIKENTAFTKPFSIPAASQPGAVTVTSAPPPPAPPPAVKSKVAPKEKQLAVVTVQAPPALPAPAFRKDDKALQIIAEFISAVGGEQALNKVNSYALKGKTRIAARGTEIEAEISILRQKPDRYAETMNSSATGEVRQIYDGKKSIVQTEYGLEKETPVTLKIEDLEIFAPVYSLLRKDYFKSLKYLGAYDLQGKQAHVVEALTTDDKTVAFAFNVETKFLMSFTQDYYIALFDDYRAVEKMMLPFSISRGSFMKIELNEIKLNSPIDESNFLVRENCYDKAN